MQCSNCSAVLPDENIFCEECGKRLDGSEPPAPLCSCGGIEMDEDGFCTDCGRRIAGPVRERDELVLASTLAAISDAGRKRNRNEDRFALHKSGPVHVLVVCDGVSSASESQRAAALGAATAADALAAWDGVADPKETLRAAIRKAALAVGTLPKSEEADPSSTTMVAALVAGPNAAVGWAGDSRAYWFPDTGAGLQVTQDHSWLNDMVSSGVLTREAAEHSPNAHAITRWLGADVGGEVEPDLATLSLDGPGTLLLCSDGLWNYLPSPEDLRPMLAERGDAIAVARRCIDFALRSGGHDNVTAAVLQVPDNHATPEPPMPESPMVEPPMPESQAPDPTAPKPPEPEMPEPPHPE